jgi:ketosteroid isomerase-like protein
MTITRLLRTDSAQAVEWTMTGVQTKDWLGAAATNRPAAFKGMTLLFTQDDGTISEIHVYFDAAVVKAQLGVGPKELAGLPPAPPPSGAPQVIEASHSPEEEHNVIAARATLDALEKADEAAYAATMTDDVVVETLERAQPMHGRDDLKAYYRSMHKAILQLDTTLDNSLGVGHYAVAEYFIAGEQIAALGWIPAQRDKVVRLQVVDVMEIRDGKVAHVWRYDNPAQSPAPSGAELDDPHPARRELDGVREGGHDDRLHGAPDVARASRHGEDEALVIDARRGATQPRVGAELHLHA